MELRIAVSDLSRALNIMQGVVQRKNVMPILSNVLLEASLNENNQSYLTLTATDLDIGIRIQRPCEVLEPGAITVSAKSLLDIVKMLPGPQLTLKGSPNQNLNIKSLRTNAKLFALAPDEFPRLPDVHHVSFCKMNAQLFSDMIQKTLYSTSQDENRYNLTGVYLEPSKGSNEKAVMASTDGHRLSRIEGKLTEERFPFEQPVILPRKGLTELLRILENNSTEREPEIDFGLSVNQAMIRTSNTLLTMRLIDGKFPDYHQVIPKLSDKIIRASRHDFLMSLKRVSVLASDKAQSVKLFCQKGELTVSCMNPEAGEVSDNVAIEYNGPDIEIGFNARYLIDALSSVSDSNVMMRFTDPLSPALLTGINEQHHLCVVMPMRM